MDPVHRAHRAPERLDQVAAETIHLCQPMAVHVQVDHALQVLALRFVRGNQVRAQVLANARDQYLAADHSHRVMVAVEQVDQVVDIPGAAAQLREVVQVAAVARPEVAAVVQVVQLREVAPVELAKLVAHLVAVAPKVARLANRNLGRLVAKRSITYVHQLLVAQ